MVDPSAYVEHFPSASKTLPPLDPGEVARGTTYRNPRFLLMINRDGFLVDKVTIPRKEYDPVNPLGYSEAYDICAATSPGCAAVYGAKSFLRHSHGSIVVFYLDKTYFAKSGESWVSGKDVPPHAIRRTFLFKPSIGRFVEVRIQDNGFAPFNIHEIDPSSGLGP
jgi:hypothetical protein